MSIESFQFQNCDHGLIVLHDNNIFMYFVIVYKVLAHTFLIIVCYFQMWRALRGFSDLFHPSFRAT